MRRSRLLAWLLSWGALLSPPGAWPAGRARAEEPGAAPPAAEAPAEGQAPGERKGAEDPGRADERLEERILELEGAIWREIGSVESRLERIKERLAALRGARARVREPDRPGALPGPGADILFSPAEERRYVVLLRRQDDVVRRLRRAVPAGARAPDRGPEAAGEGQREALREELRGILTEILDARERARERQIESLRREIADIERAIDARRGEAARRALVEERLREILGRETGE